MPYHSWASCAWIFGLTGLLGLVPHPVAAGPATLVADLANEPVLPASSQAAPGAVLGGTTFVIATDPLHGRELWVIDRAGGGIHLLADLCPGPCDSRPSDLTVLGGRLYFSAETKALGRELWVSDGTAAGTHVVRDVCPGPCSSWQFYDYRPELLRPAEHGGEVYFQADDGVTGPELWKTDGTAAGTVQVLDANPGPGGSYPSRLTPLGNALYFIAYDGDHGRELWVSDVRGTRLVRDAWPGPDAGAEILASSESHILVLANNLDIWWLWVLESDGSERSIPFSFNYLASAVLSGDQAFIGGWNRLDLYDLRTGASTPLIQDYSMVQGLTGAGGRVFFSANDSANRSRPWVSDGTPGGTFPLSFEAESPQLFVPLGGKALFTARSAAAGQELWISDGTAAGTRPLKDLWPGPEDPLTHLGSGAPAAFLAAGSTVLFSAATPGIGRELWRTDGTAAGTALVADMVTDWPGSSAPENLMAVGERLYLAGKTAIATLAWTSDGTTAGTMALGPTAFGPFAPLGGAVYFTGGDPTESPRQLRLHRTDGTPGGTTSFPDVYFQPSWLTPLTAAGKLLVADWTQDFCFYECSELFAFDPATGQVILVRDIAPGIFTDPFMGYSNPRGSEPHDVTPLGARALFGAEGPAGDELWVTDGTFAGTTQVADLCPGTCSSRPADFVPLGGALLFRTGSPLDGFGGVESPLALWRTDGTGAGTALLATFPQDGIPRGEVGPRELAAALGKVFFLVRFPGGDELWESDGTGAGTRRVRTLSLDGLPASGRGLKAAGNRLFLSVFNESTGEELWTSDGTAAGTRLVADLNPGPGSASPLSAIAVDGRLLFAATDGIHGVEPWASDGTAPGTFQVDDLAPGAAGSFPGNFVLTPSRVFFAAGDAVHGRELWSLPRAALGFPLCQPTATTLCLGQGRFAVSVRFDTPNVPGGAGVGHVLPGLGGEQTGAFWFFSPGNAELLVKMLDGDAVNHHYWYFAGALSDVHYTVEVRDLATGLTRSYENPAGSFCGRADTAAFPSAPPPAASQAEPASAPVKLAGGCVPAAADAVCLGPAGRYRVEVRFQNPLLGGAATPGQALSWSDETGFFWFFDPANVELAVKLLDGTPVNGHRWFFYGALSDVEYTITVTDTATGARKSYHNPRGRICGGADVAAF